MLALFDGDSGPMDTLRFLEESLGIGLWAWNLDPRDGDWSRGLYGRRMVWSAGFFNLLGILADSVEPTLEVLQNATHPEDRPLPGQFAELVRAALPYEREFRVVRPHGIIRRMQCHGEILRDNDGVVVKAVGVMRDITAQYDSRRGQDAERQMLHGLIGLLDHPVWIAQEGGSALDAFGWTEITGQDVTEALGMGWLEYIHPDEREATAAAWQKSRLQGAAFEIEHRIRTRSGEYRWFRSKSPAPAEAAGHDSPRIGVSVDIHHRKTSVSSGDELKLTGAQLRAARGLLNWSVRDLAGAASVSPSTIRRLEETNGAGSISAERALEIKDALRRAGVELLYPLDGKPGVRPI